MLRTPLVPLLQPVGLGGNMAGRVSGKPLPLDGGARMPEFKATKFKMFIINY